MAIVNVNSISGINSITAQSTSLNFYTAAGHNLPITAGSLNVGTGASISSPATNVLTLGTNDSERVRIDSSGNLGIGLTNPTEKLQVTGRILASSAIRAGTTAAISSSGELLSVLGQASIRLDSPTTATTYLINADTTASTIQPYLFCSDTSGNRAGIGVEYSTARASFYGQGGISLQTGISGFGYATEKVRITDTGLVGVGTNNPTVKLTITDGVAPYAAVTGDLIQLKRGVSNGNDTTSATGITLSNNSNGFRIAYGGTSDRLRFIDGALNEVLSLINGGNIGINSTSPGTKLDIVGTSASSDIARFKNGTVDISDALNTTNWQLQVTNTNNSFANGNALIRAEYLGTNAGSNIKVFSGVADSTETSFIRGDGYFSGRGFIGDKTNAELLGYYYTTNSGVLDLTAMTASSFVILEIFGFVNPNSGGSSYRDPLHMYVYNGYGWNGSALTSYIYSRHVAPIRYSEIFPSGGTAGNICDAVWYNGSTESDSCPAGSGSHYVRLKITNYNSTYGSNFNIRVFKRYGT